MILRRLVTILLLALVAMPVQAEIARVLINEAPPYRIIGSANGGPYYTGIYIEILQMVADETGLTLDFVETPFARGFRALQAGDGDIMLGPNRSPEREAYLRYLDPPLPREPKVFLQPRKAEPIGRYEDLAGKRIAVLRGATYFDRFDGDPQLKREAFDDYAAALRLVSLGRVDTAVMPELQALWLLRITGLDLALSPYRVPGRDSHIVLSRKSPLLPLAPKMEASLRRLQAENRIARILQRYE